MNSTTLKTAAPTLIENTSGSEYISDLLDTTAELAGIENARTEKRLVPVPGKKGEIVTTLLLHASVAVAYDLLKIAVERLVNHPFYDEFIQLKINGEELSIKSLIETK